MAIVETWFLHCTAPWIVLAAVGVVLIVSISSSESSQSMRDSHFQRRPFSRLVLGVTMRAFPKESEEGEAIESLRNFAAPHFRGGRSHYSQRTQLSQVSRAREEDADHAVGSPRHVGRAGSAPTLFGTTADPFGAETQ